MNCLINVLFIRNAEVVWSSIGGSDAEEATFKIEFETDLQSGRLERTVSRDISKLGCSKEAAPVPARPVCDRAKRVRPHRLRSTAVEATDYDLA